MRADSVRIVGGLEGCAGGLSGVGGLVCSGGFGCSGGFCDGFGCLPGGFPCGGLPCDELPLGVMGGVMLVGGGF